jgi:hypothetical protein
VCEAVFADKHSRLQIFTMEELFAGKRTDMPAAHDLGSVSHGNNPKGSGTGT